MPNGGQHFEHLGGCPKCGSPRIRTRRQKHSSLLWRCRKCNGVFKTPRVQEYILPPGDDGSGYIFARSIPKMERRARRDSRSPRFRRVFILAVAVVVAILLVAGYFALMSGPERDGDGPDQRPGSNGSPVAIDSQSPTPEPVPTSADTPIPTPPTTANAAQADVVTATPTDTPVATPTQLPTRAPAPTPTQIPGRPDLYRSVSPPEHMAYIWWEWERGRDSSDNWIDEFEELVIDFTIHNNVELEGDNGLYLMLAQSKISDVGFYFGLQTDVHAPEPPYGRGKGLLLSRWETRDLANARFSETDGWTQSSGHEGDFIGVRRSYAWGAGDYRIRFAPDGDPEDDGVWFGLWITDRSTDVTTWIGSLKFPLLDGKAVMRAPTYSTMEIYGRRIRPIDIPAWHVSIKRPVGDGIKPSWGHTGYSPFEGDVMNSEVRYDRDNDVVHFKTGGTTERQTQESAVTFR